MHRLLVTIVLLATAAVARPADTAAEVQSDWSGGPVVRTPASHWSTGFSASDGVSWDAVPGQLALTSAPLGAAIEHPVAQSSAGAYGLGAVDLDRDGDLDLVGTTDAGGEVVVWRNRDRAGLAWDATVVDAAFYGGTSVRPVDVDGDGDLDLVGAAQRPGHRLAWWRNDSGSWVPHSIDDLLPVACNLQAVDLDRDGDPDVVSTSWTWGEIAWWRNDGGDPVVWTKHPIGRQFFGAHSAEAADLDGDGDVDVVGTAAQSGRVTVFVNDGADPPGWSPVDLSTDHRGVRYALTADVDGDGRTDVVAAGEDGQVTWWRNLSPDPAGWAAETIDDSLAGGHWVAVADLDGDGRRDVLAAAYLADAIVWYRRLAGGGWERHDVAGGLADPLTAIAADLDGDGDLDVAGTSHSSGAFRWWEVTRFGPDGWLDGPVLDRGDAVPERVRVTWDATTPPATRLRLAVRSGDDPDSLGPWPQAETQPFETAVGRYVQYRVELESDDPAVSPLLRAVRLTPAGAVPASDPRAPVATE